MNITVSPDVYGVTRQVTPQGLRFLIRHYPGSVRPLCGEVHVVAAAGEDDVATLTRAYRLIRQKHGGTI